MAATTANGNYTLGTGSTLNGATLGWKLRPTTNRLTASFTATDGGTQVTNGIVADNIVVVDAAGNASSAHTTGVANTTIDTVAPALTSATVNAATLLLTYIDALSLDGTGLAPGAFRVTAGGGAAVPVNAVAVDATARTITLTLASGVSNGQTVMVSYADPHPGSDDATGVIQDQAGNDAASFVNQAVINNTPVPSSDPGPTRSLSTGTAGPNVLVGGAAGDLLQVLVATTRSRAWLATTSSTATRATI